MSNVDTGLFFSLLPLRLTCDRCKRPLRRDEAPHLDYMSSRTYEAYIAVSRHERILTEAARLAGWTGHVCPDCADSQPTLFGEFAGRAQGP